MGLACTDSISRVASGSLQPCPDLLQRQDGSSSYGSPLPRDWEQLGSSCLALPVEFASWLFCRSPDPPPAAEARGAGGQGSPPLQHKAPSPGRSSEGHKGEPEEHHTSKVTITKIPVCIYSPNYAVQFRAAKSRQTGRRRCRQSWAHGPGEESSWQQLSPALLTDRAKAARASL